jgi:O-antigen/teichoic acid export membrane protein
MPVTAPAIPKPVVQPVTSTGDCPPSIEHHRLLTGAATLGIAHAGGQVCSFVRNVLLTRLLGPDEFGVACAFAALVAGLDMMSDLSVDKLVVQSRRGNDPRFVAVLHHLLVLRAVILAVVLFATGGALAAMFSVPEAANAFRGLALVPLVHGLMNLHVVRLHRTLRFTRSAAVVLIPQIATLALAWPLAMWMQSFWAMWWLIMARTVLAVALSHALSPTGWQMRWAISDVHHALRFGWPLLLNGMLMAMVVHADKLLVGSICTLSVLASYAVAALITSTPALLVTRAVGTVVFPVLSRAQGDNATFQARARLVLAMHAVMAATMMIALSLIGGPLVLHVFGDSYAQAVPLVPWFAAAASARMFRMGVVLVALSRGDSRTPLMSNMVRAPALLVQIPVAFITRSPETIVFIALIAEVPAILVALRCIAVRHACPHRDAWAPLAITFSIIILALLFTASDFIPAALVMRCVLGVVFTIAGCALFVVAMPARDRRRCAVILSALTSPVGRSLRTSTH